MFNTLAYIPNILAYTFISLLVVILGFIVIYVTHKIYTALYDNFPVARLSSNSSLADQIKTVTQPNTMLTLGTRADSLVSRKSKTALRIIVTLEPCYLAYMVFEAKLVYPIYNTPQLCPISHSFASKISTINELQDSLVAGNQLLIKYFDSLTIIPTQRDLQKCGHFEFYTRMHKNRC